MDPALVFGILFWGGLITWFILDFQRAFAIVMGLGCIAYFLTQCVVTTHS